MGNLGIGSPGSDTLDPILKPVNVFPSLNPVMSGSSPPFLVIGSGSLPSNSGTDTSSGKRESGVKSNDTLYLREGLGVPTGVYSV